MNFNYQARTKDGEVQMGAIEASSREAAASFLQKYGLYVTFLEEFQQKPFYARKISFFDRVSRKEIVLFSKQLAILFKSEVPLLESIKTLAQQAKEPFRSKLSNIAEEIEGGSTLSQAVSKHPKLFSNFYVSMVKSGEASGKLSEVLVYLAEHLEKDYQLTSKVRGAMIYPIFILGLLGIVGFIMMFFIMPKLVVVLTESGRELPFLTRMVVGFSNALQHQGYLFFMVIAGGIFFLRRYSKTKEGKALIDKYSLKIPAVGNFIKLTSLTRFSENLSTLISAGLPIGQSLEITEDVVGNSVYRAMIAEIREAVKQGETISSVLKKHPEIVTPMVIQMAIVGERTGQLDNAFKNIVGFYQQELDRGISNLLSMIEPIMMVFLGIIVAIFVAAILMPIYNLGGIE